MAFSVRSLPFQAESELSLTLQSLQPWTGCWPGGPGGWCL